MSALAVVRARVLAAAMILMLSGHLHADTLSPPQLPNLQQHASPASAALNSEALAWRPQVPEKSAPSATDPSPSESELLRPQTILPFQRPAPCAEAPLCPTPVVSIQHASVLGAETTAPTTATAASTLEWRFSGRLHVDHSRFNGVYSRDGRSHGVTYLRRADLGATVRWHPRWRGSALLERDGNGSLNWSAASIDWMPRDGLEWRLGRIDPDFGMEQSVSSSWSVGVERSSIWDLAPDVADSNDGYGIRVDAHDRGWQASVGVYDKRDHNAVVARAVMLPISRKRMRLHVGASIATTRGWHDDGRIRTRLGVRGVTEHDVGRRSTLGRAARAPAAYDNDTAVAIETAWQRGPWMLQSELLQRRLSGTDGRSTRTAHGAYVQLAWFVTGEQRRYDARRGRFGGAKPAHPSVGAWEVFYRLDGLQVKHSRSATVHTAGLSWTAHRTWRAIVSLHRARSGGANDLGETTGTAVSARVQAHF